MIISALQTRSNVLQENAETLWMIVHHRLLVQQTYQLCAEMDNVLNLKCYAETLIKQYN